jgi:hypothetical protein
MQYKLNNHHIRLYGTIWTSTLRKLTNFSLVKLTLATQSVITCHTPISVAIDTALCLTAWVIATQMVTVRNATSRESFRIPSVMRNLIATPAEMLSIEKKKANTIHLTIRLLMHGLWTRFKTKIEWTQIGTVHYSKTSRLATSLSPAALGLTACPDTSTMERTTA